MKKYQMATVVFGAKFNFPFTEFFLKDYLYEGDLPCSFEIDVSLSEVEEERRASPEFDDDELENIVLLRKLCDQLLQKEGIVMFHSSAVMLDGDAYLFTAPSGTGKSTHASLWIKTFGERAKYINDDKPFLKITDDGIIVYGNPWTGKHCLGNNISAKAKGVCKIDRAKQNRITKLDGTQTLLTLLDQIDRPKSVEGMDKLLSVIEQIVKVLPFYRLECDISEQAVQVAYNGMAKGEIN